MFAISSTTWPVHGCAAGAGICSCTGDCSALRYRQLGCAGMTGLTSVSSLGTHAQGTVLQESIFVEAGSRVQSGLSRRMTLITSAHAELSCDTRSHALSEYVDWRFR